MKRVILTSLVLAATSLLSAAEAALTVSDTEKRWETARQSELKFDPPQTDLSAYRRVTLRLCAEGNLPATIMVLFHSAHAKGRGYYAAPLTITRPGWQSCTLELNELKPFRTPAGWRQITSITLNSRGWETKVPAGFRLKIGKIVLSAGAVPDEEMRSAAETAAETASPFLTIPGGNRLWETAQQAELKFEPPQTDLSAYRRVTLRLRPAGSLPATIMVLFHSAHAKGRGYYAAPLTLNSPDWNDYTLELNRLTPFRSPAGWHQITSITLNSKGWEAKVPAGFRLEIGEIRLSSGEAALPASSAAPYWPDNSDPETIARSKNDPQLTEKLAAIDSLRRSYRPQPRWRPPTEPDLSKEEKLRRITEFRKLLRPDGGFTDIEDHDQVLAREIALKSPNATPEHVGEAAALQAKDRLEFLLDCWNAGIPDHTPEYRAELIRSLTFYFDYELNRNDFRWIASAFHMPGLAIKAYFTFFDDMESVETGRVKDPELVRFNRLCRAVASECFLHPIKPHFKTIVTASQFRRSGGWVGGNFCYRPLIDCALVCRNPAMIDVVAEVCRKALSVTSYNTRNESFWQEGLTADGAGWGHTRQNYLYRYVRDGMRGIVDNCLRLKGTPWEQEIGSEAYRPLIDYIGTTIFYCYDLREYGPTLMAPGRDGMVYRPKGGFQDYNVTALTWSLRNKLLPPEAETERAQLQEYLDIIDGKRPEPVGCRYYFNNDDLIQRRADYFCGINMTSSRTKSHEVVAAASVGTDFLADGATFLMKRPGTYNLARGYWTTTAIPGVTARRIDYTHDNSNDSWDGTPGLSPFAGGVTDGEIGCCAFEYARAPYPDGNPNNPKLTGVTARKAYFLTDHELVQLVCGVKNLTPEIPGTIHTTVDQTEWVEPLTYTADGGKPVLVSPGNAFTCHASQIAALHAGIGYLTLTPGNWVLSGDKRPARWHEFDLRNRPEAGYPAELPMMELHLDHGREIADGAGAYLVNFRPGTAEEFARYCAEPPVEILANTRELQAVRDRRNGCVQAVFYEPGELRADDLAITVDAPVLLMLRNDTLHAADPLQDPARKSVSVTLERNGVRTLVELPMPDGVNSGKTVSISTQKESQK